MRTEVPPDNKVFTQEGKIANRQNEDNIGYVRQLFLMYTKYYIKLLNCYIFDSKPYAFILQSEYSVGFLYNGIEIWITMKMNNDRREMMMISEAFQSPIINS